MIRVNDRELDAALVITADGSMSISFVADASLSEIESWFPAEVTIEVVDNGTTTAKYYNKSVESIKVFNGESRTVTVVLRVSELQGSAEDEINDRIDTSDGAVEELAAMAAEHEVRMTSIEEIVTSLEEQVNTLLSAFETKTEETTSETEAVEDNEDATVSEGTMESTETAEASSETDKSGTEAENG